MTDRELINTAREAMKMAYVPYSRFAVGAALECDDGTVFTGCNIENAAFGCTVCAEQSAVSNAVSSGHSCRQQILLLPLRHLQADPYGVFPGYGGPFRQDGRQIRELPALRPSAPALC